MLIFRYMVDAADREKVEASRNELHNLLDKPQLQGIPVSVLLKPDMCDSCTSHAKLGVGSVTATVADFNCNVFLGFGSG